MPEPLTSPNTTEHHAVEVLEGRSQRGFFGRLIPFLGPAFIASIAYMDPGNFATNIEGGAQFGYLLVWVVVASNLMAMLVQALSAKLGIASGLSLPEAAGQAADAERHDAAALSRCVRIAVTASSVDDALRALPL